MYVILSTILLYCPNAQYFLVYSSERSRTHACIFAAKMPQKTSAKEKEREFIIKCIQLYRDLPALRNVKSKLYHLISNPLATSSHSSFVCGNWKGICTQNIHIKYLLNYLFFLFLGYSNFYIG